MGLQPALPIRNPTARRLAHLPTPLQPSPTPHRNRRPTRPPRSQPHEAVHLVVGDGVPAFDLVGPARGVADVAGGRAHQPAGALLLEDVRAPAGGARTGE